MFISFKPIKGFSSGRAAYHKAGFHAFLRLHSGINHAPKDKGSSSASTVDDQLISLIFIVNDSELLTVHRERINLWS
jgi:hypothetical protein